MKGYLYQKVDAFTSVNSLGNPAACIYLEDDQSLPDNKMQDIARQHKGFVSEVVYCSKASDSTFDLVYYSSECEVNFCGHGTIACMYSIIKDTPELLNQEKIQIRTRRKGTLDIYNHIQDRNAVYISAPDAVYLDLNISMDEIAKNLCLSTAQISADYPVDFIDAGNRTLIVPVAAFDDEVNLFPDQQKLQVFSLENGIDVILIFCFHVKDKKHAAHTRVFAPRYGYLEDPATGSANAAFGYYMLNNSLWNRENITLEQGGADTIFNTVNLSFHNGRLLFGGSATTRIKGVYYI